MHPTLRALLKRTADKVKVPHDKFAPPERFVSSLDLGRMAKKTKRAAVNITVDALLHEVRSDPEWFELCRVILGRAEMAWRAKRWQQRWKQDPQLMRDILGEVRFRANVLNRGAYAEKLWKKEHANP